MRAIGVTVLERKLARLDERYFRDMTYAVACLITVEVDVNVARIVVAAGVTLTVVETGISKHEQAPDINAAGWRVKLLNRAAWEFAWRSSSTSRLDCPPAAPEVTLVVVVPVVLSVIVLISDWVVCVLMIGVVTEVDGIVMVVPD